MTDEEAPPEGPDAPDVFAIVGTGRTGSTVLGQSLDRHPDVHVIPEMKLRMTWGATDVADVLADVETPVGAEAAGDVAEALLDIDAVLWRRASRGEGPFTRADLEDWVVGLEDHWDLLRLLVAGIADETGADVVGVKFPVNVAYAGRLREALPGLTLIHTVRDPRAAAASNARRFPRQLRERLPVPVPGPVGYLLLVLHKIVDVNLAVRFHRRHGDGRYHVVRFEDVVVDPDATLKAVCEALDLPFRAEMLDVGLVNATYGDDDQVQGFDPEAATHWRSTFPRPLSALVHVLAYPAFRAFGYPADVEARLESDATPGDP